MWLLDWEEPMVVLIGGSLSCSPQELCRVDTFVSCPD